MGFWIMILSGLIGLEMLHLGFNKRAQKPLRPVLVGIGIILMAFAIYVATPLGADLILKVAM
ncbi:hypothetical protein FEZ41_08655 [Lentilactobacillus parafarraginis]|jgi:hypothetical protein|uniref:Uncharacterized protein n=1 Tax=Lentilactobacillus parafarraginis TaxID=390842 RepID=A0A5R9CTD2_9LACO|nr:hypothetical protein [Lentilactobacillus parafarraginis]TLQ18641.1 hypothetical protein FEZ41_08655 [Lentilactobacillus parafarraginis]